MRFPLLAEEMAKRTRFIMRRLKIDSVDDFAYRCGIDRSTMYAILNAENEMCLSTAIKICAATNTPIEEFTRGCAEFVTEKCDKRKVR